ncbi:MAG TPA: hypothetical protein VHU84_19050, partial [Lacipirellulaceae bacterium]|nr:hypothetical protein [Lacipirellulaceae bacterium]
ASLFAPTIDCIAERWPTLPPHIRDAVLTLIEVSGQSQGGGRCAVSQPSSRRGAERASLLREDLPHVAKAE